MIDDVKRPSEPTETSRSAQLDLAVSVADRLNHRERLVVLMRAANASFGTIGDHLGVTRQRARELFQKALRRAPFLAGDLAFSYPYPPVEIPATSDAAVARKRAAARRRRMLLEQGRRERQREGDVSPAHFPVKPRRSTLRQGRTSLPACRETELCAQQ